VILAARWALSEGVPYGWENRINRFYVAGEDDVRSRERSREIFRRHLTDTVRRLNEIGAKVILLGQIPEFKIAVARCLQIRLYLGLNIESCFSMPRSEVDLRQANVNRALQDAAGSNPNVAVFWPFLTCAMWIAATASETARCSTPTAII
jgi:SGNH domain (fused to AT3 domains)